VIDRFGQVFDEDVTNSALAEAGVTVRPHDTAGSAADGLVVVGSQGTLSIFSAVEVDVSISEGAASGSVTANANGGNRADLVKDIKEKSLSDLAVQVTDVEGSGRVEAHTSSSSLRRGSLSSSHVVKS